MKMKLVLITIGLFLFKFSDGQISDNCKMLMQIFNNGKTQRKFGLNYFKNSQKPIIIIDTKHLFDNCKVASYKGREVKLVNDSSYLEKKGFEYIIIHDILKKTTKSYIVIEYKYNGEYGSIEFVDTKKGKRISKISVGYF